MIRSLFGTRFRHARQKAGFTQPQLAHTIGKAHSTISRAEAGWDAPLCSETLEACLVAMGLEAQRAYWHRLAAWDRMLRHMPPEAFHVRLLLEALGEAFADGRLTHVVCERMREGMSG